MTDRKRVALLGSTGSIGRQALDVIRSHPDRFQVVGLAAGGYSDLLEAQVREFQPRLVATGRDGTVRRGVLTGQAGLVEVATATDADLVLMATVGRSGLLPTLEAVRAGKTVALANKEALVMAGELVMETAGRHGAQILPVDSEHSALWQCLRGEGERGEWDATVRNLILTASGGALRDMSLEESATVSPDRVLAHPTWTMGPKVTVDSASLMNKGLEVMEAKWLFGLPLERIKVLLHRESIVHSLVEFVDGTIKAQLGIADMRIPIQYALSYPERLQSHSEPLELAKLGCLSFADVDMARYPCLVLALEAARKGQSYPAALSSANEIAVELFLSERISFGSIPSLVESVLARHDPVPVDNIDIIVAVDEESRAICLELAKSKERDS